MQTTHFRLFENNLAVSFKKGLHYLKILYNLCSDSYRKANVAETCSRRGGISIATAADTKIKITDLVLPDSSPGGTEVLLKIPVML